MSATTQDRPAWELPLLLIGAFRAVVDALHRELADRGHPDARPIHGFALQAVGPDGATVSELGRRLGVSKQAAAKTAAALERLGYLVREPDAGDARAVRIRRSPHGEDMPAFSAEIFGRIRAAWVDDLGAERVDELERDLRRIAATGSAAFVDIPGWLR